LPKNVHDVVFLQLDISAAAHGPQRSGGQMCLTTHVINPTKIWSACRWKCQRLTL